MRIVVWGINYAPEPTGIAPFNTGLCDDLRARGHEVRMVTTFPYYPNWTKAESDRGRLFRTDRVADVVVHRCWHYVPLRPTALRRIFHELSFGLTSLLRVLFLPKPDVYIVVSPPLLLGPLAALVSKLKRRPYVFHVQDLQPDAAVGMRMVKAGWFTRMLYGAETLSYRRAARVSGISKGMLAAFTRKGVPPLKQRLFPNWMRSYGKNAVAVEDEANLSQRAAAFRQKYQIAPTTFLATYSGNFGRKQGLETLVEAAALLDQQHRRSLTGKNLGLPEETVPKILILLVGAGVMRERLEAQILGAQAHNIQLMPLMDEADYHGMLAASDIALILQAPGTGQFFFPSKLLSILSVGTPVLGMADPDSELAHAIAEGQFGVNVPDANPESLASAIKELAQKPDRLAELRKNTIWVRQFSGDVILARFERDLREVGEPQRAPLPVPPIAPAPDKASPELATAKS